MPRKKSGEGTTTTSARPRQSTISSSGLSMSGAMKTASSRVASKSCCSMEQIRERAYYIYLERQRRNQSGDPISDWCQAEQELNGSAIVTAEL